MFAQLRDFRQLMREELELHNLMRCTGLNKEQCLGLKERYGLSCQDLADYYLEFHQFPKKSHVIIIRNFGAKDLKRRMLHLHQDTASDPLHQTSICRQIKDT